MTDVEPETRPNAAAPTQTEMMQAMNLQRLAPGAKGEHHLIIRGKPIEQSSGGIHIPGQAQASQVISYGRVISSGFKCMNADVNDLVWWSEDECLEVRTPDEAEIPIVVLRDDAVLAGYGKEMALSLGWDYPNLGTLNPLFKKLHPED